MTESQEKKLRNLQQEITAVELKIDKLMVRRTYLYNQAEKIKSAVPKERKPLSAEERAAQSARDKAAYQSRLQQAQSRTRPVPKLDLFGNIDKDPNSSQN